MDDDKARAFAVHYGAVYTREVGTSPPIPTRDIPAITDLAEITDQDVLPYLQLVNPNKSYGPDGIHPLILLRLAEKLALH